MNNQAKVRIFVSAGEASGDAILGAVLKCLRERNPNMELQGLGGPRAEVAGLRALFPLRRTAVSGAWDVLRHAFFLLHVYRRAVSELIVFRPNLVLLVDYPGLNLRLARRARGMGIPVYFIAPPQTWAYRRMENRAARTANVLAGCSVHVLFPFEAVTFAMTARRVTSGHFLVMEKVAPPRAFKQRQVLCLCPGSRFSVLQRNLPIWLNRLESTGILRTSEGMGELEVRILVPDFLAVEVTSWLRKYREGRYSRLVPVQTEKESTLAETDLAMAFPGTFTLELALHRVPTVVVAVLDPLTLSIGKRILASSRLSLPNLLLRENVFPEWAGTATDFTNARCRELVENLRTWNQSWEPLLERLIAKIGTGGGAEIVSRECEELLAQRY